MVVSKSFLGCKTHQAIQPIIENGKVISNITETADIFNKYFASQNKLAAKDIPQPLPDFRFVTETRLDLLSFTKEQVHPVLVMA